MTQEKTQNTRRAPGRRARRGQPGERDYDQTVIEIKRVSRTVKGGKRMRFRALVAVGDHKGKVGVGLRKGVDVPEAIGKATAAAKKNIMPVKLQDGTVPHEIKQKHKASYVFLKPASEGTGIIAGGAIRQILELAGVRNILSKAYGSRSKVNTSLATYHALKNMETMEDGKNMRK